MKNMEFLKYNFLCLDSKPKKKVDKINPLFQHLKKNNFLGLEPINYVTKAYV